MYLFVQRAHHFNYMMVIGKALARRLIANKEKKEGEGKKVRG
jgi:hypothetical protein